MYSSVVALLLCILCFVIYFRKYRKVTTKVPGLSPSSKTDGNLLDVTKAGGIFDFLIQLHKDFGPIASFWWGTEYVVSIADAKLFKELQHLFDRPELMVKHFEPLVTSKNIHVATGAEGQARYEHYCKCFNHSAMKRYYVDLQKNADEVKEKWLTFTSEQHVPITEYAVAFIFKNIINVLFGKGISENAAKQFKKSYDLVWGELEAQLSVPPTEEKTKLLEKEIKHLKEMIRDLVNDRRKNPPQHGEYHFIDALIDYTDDEVIHYADAMVLMVASFQTSYYVLAWCLHHIADKPEIQDKMFEEIQRVLGHDTVDHTNAHELVYLRQVLDETLRCVSLGAFTSRIQPCDTELGGYTIPKDTPILLSMGVMFLDEKLWPSPEKFDPERFNKENSKARSKLDFCPFGFAGKRICLGYRFAYASGMVFLSTLVRSFKFSLVGGQQIKPVRGIVTRPSGEVWIKLSRR